MEARTFWSVAPGVGELRSTELGPPGDGEVLVRSLYSGVSRGTESTVFLGRVPASQREAMRGPFQEGDFPFPVTYGYLSVGVVELGPASLLGATVSCLHPHAEAYVVPADAVHVLPEGLPPGRAVLAGNAETAVNALWDAGPRVGDRLSVVGAGVVGCLVAGVAARIPGTEVELVDVDPSRAEVAERLGVGFADPEHARGERDLVWHASGTGAGLARSLELLGREAEVVELSWYGDRPVTLPLGEGFHPRRLTIRSSQVGTVAPARAARRTFADRMATALHLLLDERFDVLLTGESAFDELPAVMPRLASGQLPALCHRIRY